MDGRGLLGDVLFPPELFRDADNVANRPSALMAFPVFYRLSEANVMVKQNTQKLNTQNNKIKWPC